MTEPTNDEDWAAGLQAFARGAAPRVPVDVPGAVRRGRRRRAARSVALGGGSLAVVVGVVAVAGPSLLGGLGQADSGSADSAASVADGAETAGGSSIRVLSVEELAADVARAPVPAPAQDQPSTGYDSSSVEQLVVEQHGEPDPSSYRSAIDAATGTVPRAALESSARPSSGAWPAATVACLQGVGWYVVSVDDGWSAQIPTSSSVQFLADVGTCTPAA